MIAVPTQLVPLPEITSLFKTLNVPPPEHACDTEAEAGEIPTVIDCKIGASNVRITPTINLRNLDCKFLTSPFGPNRFSEDWGVC